MTDKERLDMIKHDFEERSQYGGFIDDYDTLWLIEQVEKLEKIQVKTSKNLTKCRSKLADIKIILNT